MYGVSTAFIIATIALGIITLYLYRDRLGDIEEECNQEQIEEEKRKEEFLKRYPRINRIPILRNMVRWMDEEGWIYSLFLFIILLFGAFLRFYNLGYQSLTTDEIYQAISMKSILVNGVPLLPNGGYYTRGLPQSYLGSFFALFFGANEFSIRLPSVFAGIGLIVLLYLIGREFRDKNFGLILASVFSLFPWAIEFSRWGRMYNLVTFLILFTFYFSYIGFKYKKRLYIIVSLISTILAILTHQFGFLTPIILLSSYMLTLSDNELINLLKSKRVLYYSFISLLIIPFVNIVASVFIKNGELLQIPNIILHSYNFIIEYNYNPFFIDHIYSQFPFMILGIYIFIIFSLYNMKKFRDNLYLFLFSFIPLILVSYYHLHSVTRYLFFAMPLLMTIGLMGFYDLFQYATSKVLKSKTIFFAIILILILSFAVFVNLGYSLNIPFREHGDIYENPYYAPTTVTDYIPDTRSNSEYLINKINGDEIIITNRFAFLYFYLGLEADYYLNPGSNYFCKEDERGCKMYYMNKTYLLNINKESDCSNIITNSKKDIYLVLNLKGGHEHEEEVIRDWLKDTRKGGYNVEKIFVGAEKYSVVYKVSKDE